MSLYEYDTEYQRLVSNIKFYTGPETKFTTPAGERQRQTIMEEKHERNKKYEKWNKRH